MGEVMWRSAVVLLTCAVVNLPISMAADTTLLKVMSFNIRYGTAPDKENAWPNRRQLLFKVIKKADSDVIGLQEALQFQLEELATAFPRYSFLGVGRNADGEGEYSAILYDRFRFDVRQADTFWLSDTTDLPGSTTWGNSLPRICSWAQLFDRKTRHVFYLFNTHWDHQSQPSRENSGELIRDRIDSLKEPNIPVLMTGDFNVGQRDPAWVPLLEVGLKDSYRVLHHDTSEVGTFHAFRGKTEGDKIDAVLVSPQWRVEAAEIIRDKQGGHYPSDHFPVTATLSLRKLPDSPQPKAFDGAMEIGGPP